MRGNVRCNVAGNPHKWNESGREGKGREEEGEIKLMNKRECLCRIHQVISSSFLLYCF